MSTRISQVLKEQYSLAEEYANAQSRLLNATIGNDSRQIALALKDLDSCRSRVRSNLLQQQQQQQQQQEISSRLYPQHVALSHRVLQTIANNPSWHANGIPSYSQNNATLEINTVALASLKASISNICDSLEQ
jgi:hypothetical protein